MRTRWIRLIFLLAIMLVVQPLHAARAPLLLNPAAPWVVNYADDSCRMYRVFGSGRQEVVLMIDRYGPGERFRLIVAGPVFRDKSEERMLAVQFGPAEPSQRVPYFAGDLGKDRPALLLRGSMRVTPLLETDTPEENIFKPQIGREREAAITYVLLGRPLINPIRLETGSMRKPFEALDKCVNELMTHWGIDVSRHATLKQMAQPTNSPGTWVTDRDYPATAMLNGQRGIVNFRLSVGTDGKARSCHIQESTRPKEFDDAVCKAMIRRANFKPALDKDGVPIDSFYRNTVTFSTGH
jgi:TonB family protein